MKRAAEAQLTRLSQHGHVYPAIPNPFNFLMICFTHPLGGFSTVYPSKRSDISKSKYPLLVPPVWPRRPQHKRLTKSSKSAISAIRFYRLYGEYSEAFAGVPQTHIKAGTSQLWAEPISELRPRLLLVQSSCDYLYCDQMPSSTTESLDSTTVPATTVVSFTFGTLPSAGPVSNFPSNFYLQVQYRPLLFPHRRNPRPPPRPQFPSSATSHGLHSASPPLRVH